VLARYAFLLLSFAFGVALPGTAFAADVATRFPSTLTPTRPAEKQALPVVLSDSDAALYRQMFSLARQYDWVGVDEAASKLGDPLLVGHLLALRYLGATAQPATAEEINAWLAAYGDHPQAARVAAALYPGNGIDYGDPEVESSQLWAIAKAAWTASRPSRATPDEWNAGLAAWRAGDYPMASSYFQSLVGREDLSKWTRAAAGFWTARANLLAGKPDQVAPWLAQASQYRHTFYGLMARRMLGLPFPYDWTPDDRDQAALKAFCRTAGGRRALALLEIDEKAKAESELKQLVLQDDVDLAHGAMIVAEAAGMAQLAMKLDRMLHHYGIDYSRASYPIPTWVPNGGFTVDRALVYAMMRQESTFNPKAVSSAGARGVMQLMPATARFVARRTGVGEGSVSELVDPESNMALGQRYIEMLLADGAVNSDLFRLAAAWNGGPGNLGRWARDGIVDQDSLLFIESIPLSETRDFVERILANLWIYRNRMGQSSPSLDALAAGAWPGYDGSEVMPVEVAEHGQY
jgi:Soluble lytic murein transglycosylase and related regulatory proteins (some contain LysM/invasin domains)